MANPGFQIIHSFTTVCISDGGRNLKVICQHQQEDGGAVGAEIERH